MTLALKSFFILLLLSLSFFIIVKMPVFMQNPYMFLEIDQFNPYWDMTLALFWFVVFSFLIAKFMLKEYFFIWLIKSFITLIVMLPYEAKYTLDAYIYFTSLIDINNEYIQGTINNFNTKIIANLNHYLGYIIGESYHALKLLYSLISFLGLFFFYKVFEIIMKRENKNIHQWYIYLFFLFPTVLFWSSTLGKDSLSLFVLGVIFYLCIKIIQEFGFKNLLLFLFFFFLLYFLRYWYIGIFFLAISMYLFFRYVLKENIFIFSCIILSVVIIVSLLENSYTSLIVDKLNKHTFEFAFGGSTTEIFIYENLGDYFYYLIPNIFTTLFRPMLFDVTNSFTFIAACENIILFLLCIKYIMLNIKPILKNKYTLFLLFYVVSWLLFYVIVSPGNLGTAVRFKLQVLPIILILIGYSFHFQHYLQKESK